MLGLHFHERAFSSCGKRGPLFITVRGPLAIAASLVVEHKLQTCRHSSCGSRAQLLRGMWDLPRPGLEPVSPALAGRFSTSAPPGKPPHSFLYSFPLWFITGYWIYFPVLYSRTLLFIHPIYNSLQLLTANSHYIPPPLRLPLGNHTSVLYVCESVSVLWISSFVSYFKFHI